MTQKCSRNGNRLVVVDYRLYWAVAWGWRVRGRSKIKREEQQPGLGTVAGSNATEASCQFLGLGWVGGSKSWMMSSVVSRLYLGLGLLFTHVTFSFNCQIHCWKCQDEHEAASRNMKPDEIFLLQFLRTFSVVRIYYFSPDNQHGKNSCQRFLPVVGNFSEC